MRKSASILGSACDGLKLRSACRHVHHLSSGRVGANSACAKKREGNAISSQSYLGTALANAGTTFVSERELLLELVGASLHVAGSVELHVPGCWDK